MGDGLGIYQKGTMLMKNGGEMCQGMEVAMGEGDMDGLATIANLGAMARRGGRRVIGPWKAWRRGRRPRKVK